MPNVNIFIGYRRDDAAGHAGRLCDRLEDYFPGCVFMDVTGITPGTDFVRALEQKLASCQILIVVIGRSWLSIMRERAGRDEPDHARTEVATALQKGITVIPVLVQGARMPSAALLPADLKPLANRHALEITEPDFRSDVARLVEAIERLHPRPRRTPVRGPTPPKTAGFPLWLKLGLGLGAAALVGVFAVVAIIAASMTGDSFDPKGRWTVSQQDAQQQWLFVLTLDDGGATVQFPSSSQGGRWNYDEGQRTLTVLAPDRSPMLSLRVGEWHQDHFHAQCIMAGRPGPTQVNIRRE